MWDLPQLLQSVNPWANFIPRWAFIVTLPFTLFYLALGGISGLFMADYESNRYFESLVHFDHNVAFAKQSWKPGEHDGGVGPYWIPQLRNPSNWWVKLGLDRFDVSLILEENDTPIDQFAWLNSLYRKTDEGGEGECWHHWIYVANHLFYYDWKPLDVWDSAFNELLQYHYANPAPSDASFHYISCPSSFLCDIWKTRSPALIHFTTERASIRPDKDQENREAMPGYTPVTVRIIEFPITIEMEMALMPGVFPSPFNQMKSITSDPSIWQEHVPWSIQNQLKVRLNDIVKRKSIDYPSSFGRMTKLDKWLSKNILEPSSLEISREALLAVGMVSTFLGSRIVEIAGDLLNTFSEAVDANKRGPGGSTKDHLTTREKREPNFIAQAMREFFDTDRDLAHEKKLAKLLRI